MPLNYPSISTNVTETLIKNFLNFLLYLMYSLNIYLLTKSKLPSQLDNNLHQNPLKIMIKWKWRRKNKLVKKMNLHQDNSSGHPFHKQKNQLKITSNKYLQNSTFKSLLYLRFKGEPLKEKFIRLSLVKHSVLLKCQKVLRLILQWLRMPWLKATLCWPFKIITMEPVPGKGQW